MKFKVYWWKDEANFGDVASQYLCEKLIGDTVVWASPQTTFFSEFKRVVRSILLNEGNVFPLFKGYIPPWRRCLFAIGSILDHANYKTIVWGSGFREFTSKYRHSKILAVRGKLSLDILPSKMDKKNIALGDPALLLPLIYHSQSKKKVKVGIVPHFVDYAFFFDNYADKYNIIDVRTNDVEGVIDQINESEYILSSSLHGIIIAHAYGIPALWIKKGFIKSSEFKFYDYFSTVGISQYKGFENIDEILFSESSICDLFERHSNKSQIVVPLKSIQEKLLNTFPYPINI